MCVSQVCFSSIVISIIKTDTLAPPPPIASQPQLIDVAIKHTPTIADLHVAKGMILKRAGDLQGAFASVDEARSMDLAGV